MIKITKSKEPKEWTQYKNTPGVSYQPIPELVDALLKEQGYICAYCMRRIPNRDKLYKKDGIQYVLTNESHRVEHILSRYNHPDKQLHYDNMVICCPGHIGSDEHCDRLKGDSDISFSPLNESFIATLSYRKDGTIVSSNAQYNTEINDVLNLNTPLLKRNRRASWEAVENILTKANDHRPWNKAILSQYIKKYSSKHCKDEKMQYIPYCGIVVYFLNKKLNQLG